MFVPWRCQSNGSESRWGLRFEPRPNEPQGSVVESGQDERPTLAGRIHWATWLPERPHRWPGRRLERAQQAPIAECCQQRSVADVVAMIAQRRSGQALSLAAAHRRCIEPSVVQLRPGLRSDASFQQRPVTSIETNDAKARDHMSLQSGSLKAAHLFGQGP